MNNGFIPDFIMVIPFYFLFENVFPERAKLFFFLKVFRVVRGLKTFNVSKLMDNIKDSSIEQMEKRIVQDPELGKDKLNDHNKIVFNIYLGNALATIKLVIIIFNISFFMGVFWLVFCDLSRDILQADDVGGDIELHPEW